VGSVTRQLLEWSRPTRIFLCISVGLGAVRAGLVVIQAWLIATIVAGTFVEGTGLSQQKGHMTALVVVVALRAATGWASEVVAERCAARVKSSMRSALATRVAVLGADGRPDSGPGETVTLAVRGIDGLDGYFARYLPQLVLAVVVPVTVLASVAVEDWLSALILIVTLPLIPLFMALIGIATRSKADRQLRSLQILSGHFLDAVAGLTTLKVFGRAKAQAEVIRTVTDTYRRRLMATLRITFLSSLALELLASVSVALIAVAIGLRLLDGRIGLQAGLFVLILAPEAYLPLRQLGTEYHASAEGVSAAEQVFALLSAPVAPRGDRIEVPDPDAHGLVIDAVDFTYPGRHLPALQHASLTVDPGEITVLTGPSGCGKSTLLAVLLGFARPDGGTVWVGDADLADLDPEAWRERVAWVPQQPHLFAATLEENIRLGRPDASPADLWKAIGDSGLDALVARLPEGLASPLGDRGEGISTGERQRVALARAFLRDAPLLLLDEPTASLDGDTEMAVVDAVQRLARGRTVVMVAHRPALISLATRVVELVPAAVGA
jgi:thiol reductant ABC exporter CydD subunit